MTYSFLKTLPSAKVLSRILPVAAMSLAGLGFIQCSGSDSDGGDEAPTGDGDSYPVDNNKLDLGGLGGSRGEAIQGLHPLCGAGSCLPDDAEACTFEGSGGAGGGPGESMGGAAGSVSFNPGDLAEVGTACRVGTAADCEGESCDVVRSCRPSGASDVGNPCVAAEDCRAGLACVGEGVSGVCRPYCCAGTENSCSTGTFCDERPLPEAPQIYVPVCIPIDSCALSEPFPCPAGGECTCKGDRACIVVRSDGATACTVPGPGQLGDPCTGAEAAECAHGFVCSPSAGCMKLCSTVAQESECPEGGTCQAPSEFPPDLGVCVGTSNGAPVTK